MVWIIGLYVNDMITIGEKEEIIYFLIKLKNKFGISKSGSINFY